MKKVKKYFVLIVLALIVSNVVFAQNGKSPSESDKKEMKQKMKVNLEKLNLSEDQVEPYKEINKKYGEMAREVRNATSEKQDKKEKMGQIRDDRNKEMKALLTVDQYKIYQEIEAERKEQMKQKQKQKS